MISLNFAAKSLYLAYLIMFLCYVQFVCIILGSYFCVFVTFALYAQIMLFVTRMILCLRT